MIDYLVVPLTVLLIAIAFYPTLMFVEVGSAWDARYHAVVETRRLGREHAKRVYEWLLADEVRRAKARCRKRSHQWVAISSEGKRVDASTGNVGIIVGFVCLCGAWRVPDGHSSR